MRAGTPFWQYLPSASRCAPSPLGWAVLVSAISSTSTFFVFLFGILLTLFFPRLGREDLSAHNLVRKGLGALLVAGGVALIELT